MSRIAEVNQPFFLCVRLADGLISTYVQAKVYTSAGTQVSGSPFNLAHSGGGTYTSTAWTPITEGHYFANYTVFSDAGYAVEDPLYRKIVEPLQVKSIDAKLVNIIENIDSGEGRIA